MLLLLGAVGENDLANQAHGDGHDPADGGVGAAELLHPEAVGDVVATQPAVLLGDGQPEETDLGELGDESQIDLLGAVPRGPVGDDLGVEEIARQSLEVSLILGE